MQRILAAKSPKEASLMSAIVSLCLVPRWLMIGGITLIGLAFITPEFRKMGGEIDFELVLPYVINNFMPAGFLGLLLAGLLSAFMSTFSATVNAGAAYLINDVYKRHIHKTASTRTLILASYVGSVLVLISGITLGFFLSSINDITQFIVNGLFGGYTAANMLKWYWWRLNGHGYFWGMLVGITSAIAFAIFVPSLHSLYAFPFILGLSAVASVLASVLTAPVDDETLKSFYRNVRPWGFWGPVHAMVVKDDPSFATHASASRDLTNCAVGIIWQLTLVTIPLYVVFRDLTNTLISVVILVVTSLFLKKFWYDNLVVEEAEESESPSPVAAPGRPTEQEA
jgi:solute:Na+ symporter, SSS family